ncbi:MAG TPA: site-specific integrase [Polyangiaceae bacterium]|nr:site-specific integrase [Polyangiaceae bacterium]
MKSGNLAGLLQAFFTDRLMHQRRASPHTIASYRDTFRLLLGFAQQHIKKAPAVLTIKDLDAPFISAFLDHLERDRGVSVRSRNVRLAAIHSFFRYVALEEPSHVAVTQRVLAMPTKRYTRRQVEFLSRSEVQVLLAAPDRARWAGRRDHALLLLAVQTGLRCSELTGLQVQHLSLGSGAHVRCVGKGRKERCTPLLKDTAGVLRAWIRERGGSETDPLFPSTRGGLLGRDGVQDIVAKHVATARLHCASLKKKRVTPHVLRHSAAMNLLQHGVDRTVIALWLGHESVETTQIYLDANLQMKEQALAKAGGPKARPDRFRPDDRLLAFLKRL